MKISNQSQLPRRGYAVLFATLSLSLTIIAFAITAFRDTRQSHRVQSQNQVRLDYSQKERAFLRALLHVVPNSIIGGMMPGASTTPNDFSWDQIFQDALAQAQTDMALDTSDLAILANLDIDVNVISANTGNSSFTPTGLITAPNSSGNFILDDLSSNRPSNLLLPPQMTLHGGGNSFNRTHPIIALNKTILGNPIEELYTEMPYPEISFGYTQQGATFIAKRNWWAFTVNFGANSEDITGIAPSPRTYVLSVYEVPSQLAISSSAGTTSLGSYDNGVEWDPGKISITGSIYTDRARIENLNRVGSVASRLGVGLGSSAPSDQSIGGLVERRETLATTNTFYPYSSSGDSGLVSFTPINRGTEFFDFFVAETNQGLPNQGDPVFIDPAPANISQTIGDTGWNNYSVPATQTAMRIEVGQVSSANNQLPQGLFITAKDDNGATDTRQRATRGTFWNAPGQPIAPSSSPANDDWPFSPAGDDWFLQSEFLPNGRPCLTLDLERLPAFLAQIGLDDVTINNSLWIGPNYTSNDPNAPRTPTFPSQDDDMALLIKRSEDLSAYTNGLTIITPLRIYFGDNFNDVATTPPAGSGITEEWFPPVSVFAPEKRFGTENTGGVIELDGQLGILPTDVANGSVTNPLDLRDGGDAFTASSIEANLTSIQRKEDLPPLNALSWLTVIEEVR